MIPSKHINKETSESLVRLKIGIAVLVSIFITGTIGFYYIEGTPTLLDAFYYTLVTVSTVGYGDITPVTPEGKVLASVMIIMGVGAVFIVIPNFFEFIVKKEITEVLKLPEERSLLENHVIVCGWGKVGKTIVDELAAAGQKFAIIESNPQRIKHLVDRNYIVIEGDARSESILEKANIDKAKTLFATLDDAANVFIVLTAKILNPQIQIVSKVDYFNNEAKLIKAGADHIINCHKIGAKHMLGVILE
jgi:voltage-gated potassium channel